MNTIPQSEIEYELAHASQSRQAEGYATISIFFAITVFTVAARLLARKHQEQRLALDDCLLVAATVFMTVEYVSTIEMIKYAIGKHLITIKPGEMILFLKWEVVNLYSFTTAISLCKLSILTLVLRIFEVHSRIFRICVYFMAAWVTLWAIGLYFAYGFQCTPFSKRWSLTDACQPSYSLEYSASILNAVSDMIAFILPQPIIWKLQLPTRKKIPVSFVFVLGFAATVMGIMRTVYVKGVPGSSHPADFTYTIMPATIFNMLEPCFAIIAASLPSIPGFLTWLQGSRFVRVTSRLFSTVYGSKSNIVSKSGSSESQKLDNTFARIPSNGDDHSRRKVHVRTDVKVSNTSGEPDEVHLMPYGHSTQTEGCMV